MSKFIFSTLFFLTLIFNPLFADPSGAIKEKLGTKIVDGYQSVNLDLYSAEELYPLCKAKKFSSLISVQLSWALTPENFQQTLVHMMCNRAEVNRGGDQEDFKLKFELQAQKFIKNTSSKLPICTDKEFRNNCLGQGLVFNGFYVGEWLNNIPHGQGVQFLTKNLPYGFMDTFSGIYEGSFAEGQFNGIGYYQSSTKEESFEGNWLNGQMHGFINWVWPKEYKFGIRFSRDTSNYLKIDSIEPFSAAEAAGLKTGDLIQSLQSGTETLDTSKNGIATIGRFFDNLPIDQEVLFSFLSNTDQIPKTLPISKLLSDSEKKGIIFCLDTPQGECYQDAQYKNEFIRKGLITRSSYMMGLQHAYQRHDLWVAYNIDGSKTVNKLCRGRGSGMGIYSLDKELLEKYQIIGGSLLYIRDDIHDACPNSFPTRPSYMHYPEVLVADTRTIEDLAIYFTETADSDPWLKNTYDITDWLYDAINLRDGGNKIPNNHPIHELCTQAVIDSLYCDNGKKKYEYYLLERISRTPGTKAFDNRKKNQLLRAKENFAVLAACKNKSPVMGSQLHSCMQGPITRGIQNWECFYRTGTVQKCDFGTGIYRNIKPVFRAENKDMLDAIDYDDWIFGDL